MTDPFSKCIILGKNETKKKRDHFFKTRVSADVLIEHDLIPVSDSNRRSANILELV